MVLRMFEWKPPDPRLVALVRRLEAAILRHLPGGPASGVEPSRSNVETAGAEPSDEAVRTTAPPRDGDPPAG
jgi:hypothetical protein